MRKVIEFNEEWKFTKEGKSETVNIPHCWNAVDGQEGADYYRGECVYEKTLSGVSGKTYIEVGAANSVSALSSALAAGSSAGVSSVSAALSA